MALLALGVSSPSALLGQDRAAEAGWSTRGVRVRFPAELAPTAIGVDTVVGDRFSGYEWRVVLESGPSVQLVAFVIPPHSDHLTIARYSSNEAALRAGGARVRWCDPDLTTIRCGRVARGLVRLVGQQLEVVVTEPRWYQVAAAGDSTTIHLGVRRGGESLWTTELPLRRESP